MAQNTKSKSEPSSFPDKDKMIFSENGTTAKTTDFSFPAALFLSITWIAAVTVYILKTGWQLAYFEMTLLEFMSFIAGVLAPFAFIWVAAAYFSSQRQFVSEAKKLHDYLCEFTCPTAQNKNYTKNLLDNIRKQAADMNSIYTQFKSCTGQAETRLIKQLKDLHEFSENLTNNINLCIDNITSKTHELKNCASLTNEKTAHNIEQMETNLNAIHHTSEKASETLSAIVTSLRNDITDLQKTGDVLTDRTRQLSEEIREQKSLLDSASENACNLLAYQTDTAAKTLTEQSRVVIKAGNEVHDSLNLCFEHIKQDLQSQISLLSDTSQKTYDNVFTLTSSLQQQNTLLCKTSETERNNIEKTLIKLEERIESAKKVFDYQNEILSQKDEALMKTAEDIQAVFKDQNNSLDQESKHITSHFKTMETAVDNYVAKINTLTDQMASAFQNLDDKAGQIEHISARTRTEISAVDQEIGNKSTFLSNALTDFNKNAHNVYDALTDETQKLTLSLQDAGEKLSGLQENIRSKLSEINEYIATTEEKSIRICDNLTTKTTDLSDVTETLASKTAQTEMFLTQQHAFVSSALEKLEATQLSLSEHVNGFTGFVETLDAHASNSITNLSKSLKETLDQTQTITDQVDKMGASLTNKIDALNSSAQHTLTVNSNLSEELEQHKTFLDETVERISSYAKELNSEVSRQTTQMKISSEQIQSRSQQAVLQINEQFQKLIQDAQLMLDQTQKASSGLTEESGKVELLLERQNSNLSILSDKLSQQSTQISAILKEQSNQADQDLEKLTERIRSIEGRLSGQTQELTEASEKTIEKLESVCNILTNQTASLTTLSQTAQTQIIETGETAFRSVQKLSDNIQEIHDKNNASAASFEDRQTAFKQTADELIRQMTSLQDEIAKQTEELQKQSEASTRHVVEMRDYMRQHITELDDVVNAVTTKSRLNEASLNNRINTLKQAAGDVMTNVQGVNEIMNKNTNDLLTVSSRIEFELEAMGENLRRRSEESSRAAQDSLTKSHATIRLLEKNAGVLDEITGKIIEKINIANNEFAQQTNRIEAAGEIARDQIRKTGETFLVQSHQLNRISQETQKTFKNFSILMRERAGDFNKIAESAGIKINSFNDTVRQTGREFEEISAKGAAQVDQAIQRLRTSITDVTNNSERMIAEVRKSAEQFTNQSGTLSSTADSTLQHLHELLVAVRNNIKEMQESGEKVSAQSIKIGGAFNRQVQALISASRSAEEHIFALNRKKEEADTQRFMRETSFIIEKLQSLGVDIARIYTPNVEEDLWKRYYSGDKNAFVRYLSRTLDKNQIRKMIDLFTENSEFREYVSRFVFEFQSVLTKARQNERADVLINVLLGSEAGHLYMILNRVFNKEA